MNLQSNNFDQGQWKIKYIYKVIAISIIMQTRLSKTETIKFRSDLEFNQINLILKKEQSILIIIIIIIIMIIMIIITPLLKAFSAEKIKLQHKTLENERVKTDTYFSEHELVVEIDKRKFWQKLK